MRCKKYASWCFLLVFLFVGEIAIAQTDIAQVRDQIAIAKDDTNKVNLYKKVVTYYRKQNLDTAYKLANEALKLATSLKYAYGEAYMSAQMGMIDRVQGRLVSGKVRLQNALDIYERLGIERSIATMNMEMGVIEGMKGNNDEATRDFLRALKTFEKASDSAGMVQTYMKLGVVNENTDNLVKAESYYLKALEVGRLIHDTLNMAYTYNNMCVNQGKQEHYEKALECSSRGFELCANKKQRQYKEVEGLLLLNTGIVYKMMGNEQKALEYYTIALKQDKENNNRAHIPNLLLNIAVLDSATPPNRKIPLLKDALAIAKETDQKILQAEIYAAMADAYSEQKDYKNAYSYRDTGYLVKSKLFTVQKNSEIANMQSLYDLDKSHSKVLELQLESSKKDFQRNLTIVIAALIGIALIGVTITYRRTILLNRKLKRREEELDNANQVKDKIFSIIGHDLRAPTLTTIGMLRVLNGESDDINKEEERKIYNTLVEQSEASLETLDKLLLWGSRQIKGISLNLETFAVNKIIGSNIRLLQENATEKKISLTSKVPEGLSIYADASHFDFIVRNLLSNAIKFSNRNSEVEIGTKDSDERDFVCFYVKDQGVGIKPAIQQRIFGLNGTSTLGTGNEKGTGLGLVLCRDFVEQDGGKIWVESEEGKGATFYFLLRAMA